MKETLDMCRCDYCHRLTQDPIDSRWFDVNKEHHACSECGHGMMDILYKLDVPYKKWCTLYHDNPDEMGEIKFDNDLVSLNDVTLSLAIRFRRPG